MSALDDMRALLDAMSSRKEELTKWEGLLSEISVALTDIVACMEKPEEDDDSALISAIQGLSIKAPDIHVNVASAPPPDVNVMVQPSQVVVMPSPSNLNGLKIRITARDGNGAMSEFTFIQPEN